MTRASLKRTLPAILIVIAIVAAAPAQQRKPQQTTEETADVIRVNTELVQTDVAVVDKQGRFVEGLQPEQFELRVGGQLKPISFFESVTARSAEQEKPPAAGRSGDRARQAKGETALSPQTRGRLIFFFLDDVHLAAESLIRARQALLKFVDDELGQDDQAAIVSTSGQVGFLQQLTGNKTVLRAAIARLDNKRNPEVYAGKAPISEYDATQVAEAHNRELFRYLVEATAAEFQTDELTAANMVQNRVAQIAQQSRAATGNSLSSLEGLMRSSAALAGRKVIFFISDGFVIDPRASNALDRLRRITRTAAQVGAVIYTMDARGTFANIYTDAGQNPYPDFTGSVSRNVFAEGVATQEALRILADDTGGRAILNSNSFSEGFKRALDESSNYYLLAWRPERDEEYTGKTRIVVSVKGRPELKVRMRRGVIEYPRAKPTRRSGGKAGGGTPDVELLKAIGAPYPVRDLPVALSAGFMNMPDNSMRLFASMQLDTASLPFTSSGEAQKREVDVMGVALDDRGSISSFKQKLTIPQDVAAETGGHPFIWNQQLPLQPGLYQVRVAVRDRRSGRTGSAMQWIEIPSSTQASFSMSSIFIGERKAADSTDSSTVPVNVTRRFAAGARLRYQTYFYNATRGNTAPDVLVQVQIFRHGQPVLTMPQARLGDNAVTDPARLSLSGEIALEQLSTGRYLLQISASDQKSGKSISQQTDFVVE